MPHPSGALASLRFRSEIALRLGYRTTAGPEAVDAGRYWIDSWQWTSSTNQSLFAITAIDGWGLLKYWSARYQMRWNKDDVNPRSVWQILYQLLARVGICLVTRDGVPRSNAIDNFYPDFTINPGTPGDTAVNRLLSFVPDRLIFDGQQAYVKDLRPDEDPCYEYGTDHKILSGSYSQHTTASRARAIGRDEDANRILEEALDSDLLDLGIDILQQVYDPNLQTATSAQERADALLRQEAQRAQGGQITVPTNVAQELYDVITITDPRCEIDQAKYRVPAMHTHHDRRHGICIQRLTLCAP
jgi:nucleotide-binding universal stress UspA family protein